MGSRRRHRRRALAGLSLLLLAVLGGLALAENSTPLPQARYGGQYLLYSSTRNGPVLMGPLASVSGCYLTGQVVEEDTVPLVLKHVDPPVIDNCRIEVGLDMKPSFYSWINSGWNALVSSRDLWIVGVGQPQKYRLTLTGAVIRDVRFPELDPSGPATGFIEVNLMPAAVTKVAPCCADLPFVRDVSALPLDPSTFVFNVAGTHKTKYIEPLVFKHGTLADPTPTFPDIVGRVSTVESPEFVQWFEDMVLLGNNGPADEVTAELTVFSTGLKYLMINFDGVGIFDVDPFPLQTGGSRYKLYAEGADVAVGTQ